MLKIFKKFFSFCGKENRKKFYIALTLGVVFAFLEAFKIPAIAIVLEGVLVGNISNRMLWTAVIVLAISLLGACLVKYKSTILQTEAGYATCSEKRIEIAEHLRYLPMGYFNKNSLGYITSVTTNTMENLADVATRVVMLTTQGIFSSSLITIMILIFDYRIGLVCIAGILLFFLSNLFMQKKSQEVSPKKMESDSKVVETVLEYIQGISEVKAYNLSGESSKKRNDALDQNAYINTKLEKTFIPFMFLQGFILKLTGVAICAMSIWLYIRGSMEMMICILMLITSFIIYSTLEIAGTYSALLRVVDASVDKAQKILDTEEMDVKGDHITPENHDITFENVSFSYDRKRIINNISLKIPEKTTTAIVGPSGGGKTTLCHLASRFWDVEEGNVKLGGKNVKEYSMDSLMQNFSFVFQNVYLFKDTIANNIRFGSPDTLIEEVIDVAKKAKCHDFIMKLEDGYETVIGEGGGDLSGGEKQRISIARAIMKNAPIIILDEATANVDPENEKDLVSAIEELTKEKTIIMIAHRLKTVRNADQILVVDQGEIVQKGRHSELLKEEGIYKRFINTREQAVGWKL